MHIFWWQRIPRGTDYIHPSLLTAKSWQKYTVHTYIFCCISSTENGTFQVATSHIKQFSYLLHAHETFFMLATEEKEEKYRSSTHTHTEE